MVIRGKKKLALQIFYQSNQAQTHAPHGIYGPISVDAVYPYLQFVSSFVFCLCINLNLDIKVPFNEKARGQWPESHI